MASAMALQCLQPSIGSEAFSPSISSMSCRRKMVLSVSYMMVAPALSASSSFSSIICLLDSFS